MIDLNKVLQGLSSSGAVSGFAGGLAGTAVAGALSGKKGKKFAKSALQVGGLAAVGGLAWTAYQRYAKSNPQPGQPAPGATGARPARATQTSAFGAAAGSRWQHLDRQQFEAVLGDGTSPGSGGLLLLRAMISAAAADGHMDQAEQRRIFEEARRLELDPQEKAMLFDELQRPMGLSELVPQVTNPETAVEVYAASLVAIDETRVEGQAYLQTLALALELPNPLIQSLHEQAALTREDKAA